MKAKTFTCCYQTFTYFEGIDQLTYPPPHKKLILLHVCQKLYIGKINMTGYFVKRQQVLEYLRNALKNHEHRKGFHKP